MRTYMVCQWCNHKCPDDRVVYDETSGIFICEDCAEARDPEYDALVKRQVEVDVKRSSFKLIKGGKG